MAGNHKSGRKARPDGFRVLEGRKPVHGGTVRNPGEPEVPLMVSDDHIAMRYWRAYADQLLACRVLSPDHGEALATLALVSADYERARAEFAMTGRRSFIATPQGDRLPDGSYTLPPRVSENPMVRRLQHLADQKVKLLGEFGLTPVTATKVSGTKDTGGSSKWDRLTAGR